MFTNLFDAILLILKIKGVVSQEEYDTFFLKVNEKIKNKEIGMSQYEFFDLIKEVIK